MVEGAVLMLDVAGPFMLKARPNDRGGMNKVKVYLLLTICLFSHRIAVAILDSMTTSSLKGAIHAQVLENGWKPQELAFDAGSSLVPAAAAAAEGIHNQAGDDLKMVKEGHTSSTSLDKPRLRRWSGTCNYRATN